MKLIALLPVKNEEWILPAYLSSVVPIVDEIIAIDNASSDNSADLLVAAGARVEEDLSDSTSTWSENRIRERLLQLGRERGGTHFLCLDADEALTAASRASLRDAAALISPSQKIAMQWLALWKTPNAYRDDKSVWSNNFKDFLFRDRSDLTFLPNGSQRDWGTLRTPGENDPGDWVLLQPGQAAVAHFQFVPWARFQAKQAWYRCCELVDRPHEAAKINAMYAPTLDDPRARVSPVPTEWLHSIEIPPGISDLPASWHLGATHEMFERFGALFFEPLQIWHIADLRARFVNEVGREPRPHAQDRIASTLGAVLNRLRP